MRVYTILLIGLIVAMGAQQVPGQKDLSLTDRGDPVSAEKLLCALQLASPTVAIGELNRMLTEWIGSRQAGFLLTENLRKDFENAGADKELLAKIQKSESLKSRINATEIIPRKGQEEERMMEFDREIRKSIAQSDVESRKRFIVLGTIFLIEYGCDQHARAFVAWLRKSLPMIKSRLDREQKH